MHTPTAHVDDEKSTIQNPRRKLKSRAINRIKIRLANSSEKSSAKAQTLHACEQRLEKAEKDLQKEKDRIAESCKASRGSKAAAAKSSNWLYLENQ